MTIATDTARPSPEDCRSMSEVREGVDAIDRQLVALIAQRARFMEAAARIKPSRDVVHDEWRIADVIGKVTAEAARIGVSTEIIEPVWRELVRQSIAYEFAVWDRTRGS